MGKRSSPSTSMGFSAGHWEQDRKAAEFRQQYAVFLVSGLVESAQVPGLVAKHSAAWWKQKCSTALPFERFRNHQGGFTTIATGTQIKDGTGTAVISKANGRTIAWMKLGLVLCAQLSGIFGFPFPRAMSFDLDIAFFGKLVLRCSPTTTRPSWEAARTRIL